MTENKEPLGIYIHIPFCIRKCLYCDFLSGSGDENERERYVLSLLSEIRAYGEKEDLRKRQVSSIFFGGGTPSLLHGELICRIVAAIRERFALCGDAEITLEANPGTVTEGNLSFYKESGINRISLGLQSADNRELGLLGRIHTYEDFLESYYLARDYGFQNINVDLMYGIPDQTRDGWEETINRVVRLSPEHISAYCLQVEEGTPFAKLYGEGSKGHGRLPDENAGQAFTHTANEILKKAGYHRYEISNYARPGMECRHNLGYWELRDYLGIGLGSSGLISHTRYKNTEDMAFYLEHAHTPEKLRTEKEVQTRKRMIEEFMFLGLRKTEGVNEAEFEERCGAQIGSLYTRQLEKYQENGMLVRENGHIFLTGRGLDVSNYILADFLLG